MIWFIVPVVFALIYAIYYKVVYSEFWGPFFVSLVITFCICMVGLLVSSVVGEMFFEPETNYTGYYTIYALKDNMATSDSFFLGHGSFKDQLFYYYLGDDGRGGYQIYSLPFNNVSLKFTNEQPRIDVYDTKDPTSWYKWIGIFNSKRYYTVLLPEGSIAFDFSVDLQ